MSGFAEALRVLSERALAEGSPETLSRLLPAATDLQISSVRVTLEPPSRQAAAAGAQTAAQTAVSAAVAAKLRVVALWMVHPECFRSAG